MISIVRDYWTGLVVTPVPGISTITHSIHTHKHFAEGNDLDTTVDYVYYVYNKHGEIVTNPLKNQIDIRA